MHAETLAPVAGARIIDGNAVAKQVREDVAKECAELAAQGIVPGLTVVLVGEDPDSAVPDEGSRVLAALDQILRSYEPALYVLREFHHFLAPQIPQRATVLRRLRDVARHLKTTHKTVLLLSPLLELPAELEKDVTVVDFPLPVGPVTSTIRFGD